MIKIHQKISEPVTYRRTSSKQLLKKTFKLTQENLNIEKNLSFNEKVIDVQLLIQSDGESIRLRLLKSSCSHDGETATYM